MKIQHFQTTIPSSFTAVIVAGMLFNTPVKCSATLYQIDIAGTFPNVPFGTVAFNQVLNSGAAFSFTFYLDKNVAITNRTPLGNGSIYFDPTHSTRVSLNGEPFLNLAGVSKLKNENVGGPNSITLTQEVPNGLVIDPFFGTGSARADFQYINGSWGSLDGAISALGNYSIGGPPFAGAFGGTFDLLSTLNGQPWDLSGTVDTVVVTVIPVPEPSVFNCCVISIFVGALMRKRTSSFR